MPAPHSDTLPRLSFLLGLPYEPAIVKEIVEDPQFQEDVKLAADVTHFRLKRKKRLAALDEIDAEIQAVRAKMNVIIAEGEARKRASSSHDDNDGACSTGGTADNGGVAGGNGDDACENVGCCSNGDDAGGNGEDACDNGGSGGNGDDAGDNCGSGGNREDDGENERASKFRRVWVAPASHNYVSI